MTVEIRHIDESCGKELGDIPPSEIQPLIEVLKSGVPVYRFGINDSQDFEGAFYSSSQIVSYGNDNYIFEIIVE